MCLIHDDAVREVTPSQVLPVSYLHRREIGSSYFCGLCVWSCQAHWGDSAINICKGTHKFLLWDSSLKKWSLETVPIHRSQFRCHEVHLVRENQCEEGEEYGVWKEGWVTGQRDTEGGKVGAGCEAVQQYRLMREKEREREQIYVTSQGADRQGRFSSPHASVLESENYFGAFWYFSSPSLSDVPQSSSSCLTQHARTPVPHR